MEQKGTITNNGDSITITLKDNTQIIIPYTKGDIPDGTEVTITNPSTKDHP